MKFLPYILIVLSALPLLARLFLARRARRMEGAAIPFNDPEVEDKLRRHGRVLLYFFSPHCGPCRAMTPIVDRLAARHGNVVKLDVAQAAPIARSLGILGTPSTVLLKDGKVAQVVTGAASEKRLEALLAGD